MRYTYFFISVYREAVFLASGSDEEVFSSVFSGGIYNETPEIYAAVLLSPSKPVYSLANALVCS